MQQTLNISSPLYEKLRHSAQRRGLEDIEQLIEAWEAEEDERNRRAEIIGRIDTLRHRLSQVYGQMPDSTPLIQEDRMR